MTDASVSTMKPGMKKGVLWTFSAAHLCNDLVTTGMVPSLLFMYKAAFRLSYTQSGLILFFSFLTSSVLQPVFGLVTDRRPLPWLLPLGLVFSCGGLALTGLAPSFPWLLVLISLSGLGSGAFHPEASRGTHLASGRAKGLAQAIFQVGGNVGQALGPLMIPLFLLYTGLHGLTLLLVLAAFAFVLTSRLVPWYREQLALEGSHKRTAEGRNRIGALTVFVAVVILRSWCQIGVAAFLPFLYAYRQIAIAKAEWFTFLFLAAGALGTFVGGALSDKWGKKWMIFASMAAAIPFSLLLPYTSGLWTAFTLFVFGFLVLSSFAVTAVYAQMLLPRNIGLASGIAIGFSVGAGGLGATLFGSIADHYGLTVVFNLIALLPLLAACLSLLLPGDKTLRETH